jgi:AraC-like DNA-binding protein/mannose-6-phosphate isomerase-like protein (cupin superfamily)
VRANPKPGSDETEGPNPAPRSGGVAPHAHASMVEQAVFGAPMRLLTGRYAEHRYHPHIHLEYTLSVIEHGDLRFHAAGREHHARQGEVVVIPPLAVHDGRNGGPEGFGYRVLYLHPNSLRTALGRDALTLRDGVLDDARCAQALVRGHRSLLAWGATRLGAEVALLGLLEDLVPGLLSTDGQGTRTGPVDRGVPARRADPHPAVRGVAQRLDDCPHDNPSLDELALEAGLSRRHLTRLFRAEMGISVHQYQVQAKVRTAYGLIRGGATAAAAAAALGFADQAHLTRWFWRIYGVSPGMAVHI